MCHFDKLKNNKYITIIGIFFFLLLAVLHFVFYFFVKKSDFENLFDALESSPLFDFQLEDSACTGDANIVFHRWEGRRKPKYRNIVDKTDIDKINGYKFCYKHISYQTLLNNGQIIKNEETCPQEYSKDCGIVDTLKQKLCVKGETNCPLYDVGIGQKSILDYNGYDKGSDSSDIYYNNNNYNNPIKKIIGKLILNDGQPCYYLNEKLWRKFYSREVGEQHLKCKNEIFGKVIDDRYENKGDITYQQLYKDNIPEYSYNFFLKDEIKDETVSLYKREFLGIDKSCHAKYDINRKQYEKLRKSQNMEKNCLLVEFIIIMSLLVLLSLYIWILFCMNKSWDSVNYSAIFILGILFLLLFSVIICQIVFLSRMNNNKISYACSDDITNEILRKESDIANKTITYTKINLAVDIIVFALSLFVLLLIFFLYKYKNDKLNSNLRNNSQNGNFNKDGNTGVVNNTSRTKNEQIKLNDRPH